MNKLLSFCGVIILGFSNCQTIEPIPTWTVNYQVYKQSNDPITYRATYRLQNGSTKQVGPITDFKWTSEDLTDFEDGLPVSLTVVVLSGNGELELQILRESSLQYSEIKPDGVKIYSIETQL